MMDIVPFWKKIYAKVYAKLLKKEIMMFKFKGDFFPVLS
jgi:hypothetical protein